jgi:hypothetical protein
MSRYILRYTGSGPAPAGDLAAVRQAGASVVAESGRMLLVEATATVVDRVVHALDHWVASPEQAVPRPRTRPIVAARSHR